MGALALLARAIDRFNQTVGMSVAWFATFMVLVQFVVVVLRYVFGYGTVFMQESIIYMHGFLFLLGAGYTLLHDGHVRVDVFYRDASPKKKAIIDLFGTLVLLFPVCITMMIYSWPYMMTSWSILEGSTETSGIPARFILKTAIVAFLVLIMLQGVSMIIHNIRRILGDEEFPVEEEHEGL